MTSQTCTRCESELPENPDGIVEPRSGEGFDICHKCSGRAYLPQHDYDFTISHNKGRYEYSDGVTVKDGDNVLGLQKKRLRVNYNGVSTTFTFNKLRLIEIDGEVYTIEVKDTQMNERLVFKPGRILGEAMSLDFKNSKLFDMLTTAILEHRQKTPAVIKQCPECSGETPRKTVERFGKCNDCYLNDDEWVADDQ